MMKYRALLALTLVLAIQSSILAADFAAGTGEPNNPFQIATPEQLLAMGSDPNLLDKNFVLVADIDLDPNLPGGRIFTDALIAQDNNNGVSSHGGPSFEGVLDGQGHAIANMHIEGVPGYDAGLFGKSRGLIKDLRLTDVTISGSPCGAVAGLNSHGGMILRCEVNGRLSGANDVGGLVGANWNGILIECQAQVKITGEIGIGGMVGGGPGGTLMRCRIQAEVYGKSDVGGLAGQSSGGQIIECDARGTVVGHDNVGGLVGTCRETVVLRSSTDCDVIGQQTAGGLFGSLRKGISETLIADSYARGSVAGSVVGGLAGRPSMRFLNCYAACEVVVLPVEGEASWSGGLFGFMGMPNSIPQSISCFWDAPLSGVSMSTGSNPLELVPGLTAEQMRDQNMLSNAGWDLNHVWTICEGDYPKLQWQVQDCNDPQQ
jgi:hypothetical protein